VGRRLSIVLALVVGLLAVAAVGAYAWDQSRSNHIAEGVTIGGVAVGGMTADEARSVIDEELVEPLRQHVVVHYDGVKYKLSPEKLQIDADVDGMIDRALEESRGGGLPGRVWRYATGGEVDVAIAPQVTYSENAVDEFIAKVAEAVNREPVNATIEPTAAELTAVQGQNGLEVNEDKLRSRIESAVQSPSPSGRRVNLPVREIEPEVTKEELAEQYPTYITVNRAKFELTLWKNLEPVKTYKVAIGAQGYDTPTGVYHIQNKAVNPAWTVPDSDWAGDLKGQVIPGGAPNNPLKARWLGIYDGAGIHGTDDVGSLGSAASHGCVRMAVEDVIELYDKVPVGTPIYIG